MGRRSLRALLVVGLLALTPLAGAAADPPTTGFEDSEGAAWTEHENELAFLAAVDAQSERVSMSVIGTTGEGRPLHLVRVGAPKPRNTAAAQAVPTVLFVCSQHGNEPAGREACLATIRDLAFTTDPELVAQLESTAVLFVPTANPDGRAANVRENSNSIDINRDHLTLLSEEARAIAPIVRDWTPDLSIDLHEYGPSQPVLYDDDVLYLWPRNLNVDDQVHDLAQEFAEEKVNPCAAEAGYTSDVYGLQAVGPVDVAQTAGDDDEGIFRNLTGLRHSLGILIETAVSADPTGDPTEVVDTAALQRRRVDSHLAVVGCALEFLRERGAEVRATTIGSVARKTAEGANRSAPLYFDGADNTEPPADKVVDPPPCGYDLTTAQVSELDGALGLHGIRTAPRPGGVHITMGQPAEPVIGLLLDPRGDRSAVEGTALTTCPAAAPARPQPQPRPTGGVPPAPRPSPPARPLPATGTETTVSLVATLLAGVALVAAARLRRDRRVTSS